MSKHLIKILTVLLIAYYIGISWLLKRHGFEHSSGLFYSEKLLLLFNAKENTILTLGFTFPTTVFLSALLFVPLGYLYAPVASTIIMMAGLFYMIVDEFKVSKFSSKIYIPIVFAIFALHPMAVFAAVTGRKNAVIALIAFLIFRSFYRYYKQPVTYHISMASLYIGCFIFSNFEFVWLVLAFFPFIFLVSLDGLMIAKDESPLFQYYEALNNRSQRRKLANRTAALYLVIFLLPLIAVLLFRSLNAQYAGSSTYFLDSPYASWRITGNLRLGNLIVSDSRNNFVYQTQIVIQGFILFITPLYVAALILFKGKLYELFTILSMLLYYSFLLLSYKFTLNLGYYLVFIPIALVTICYYGTEKYSIRTSSWIFGVSAVLTIIMGYYFFQHTASEEEYTFSKEMSTVYKNWQGPRLLSESQQVAQYISTIATDDRKILIDDASAYTIVVHIGNLNGMILPQEKAFVTILENPAKFVKYMLIAKRSNPTQNLTVLNEFNLKMFVVQKNLHLLLMYESENWAIYQIE
ncbi:MAG: hypothetical protein K2Q21_02430 [Chitinophagaceae bacterium]|nr:hypothetical protein [Chitinophagaceae bacterium]